MIGFEAGLTLSEKKDKLEVENKKKLVKELLRIVLVKKTKTQISNRKDFFHKYTYSLNNLKMFRWKYYNQRHEERERIEKCITKNIFFEKKWRSRLEKWQLCLCN